MGIGVEFEGQTWDLEPDREFTFGRAGDLCIDESNLYLHRVVGVIRHHDGTWWLHNVGDWTELDIKTDRGSHHTMAPYTRLAVVAQLEVRFKAGKAKYMLRIVPPATPAGIDEVHVITDAPSTNRFGLIELNDDQRLMLAALCEPHLCEQEGEAVLPGNQVVANRLGWSITKFNRKLDYLCRRLAEEGVPGLQGERGERATARRQHLVEHVLKTGLITEDDLRLLD